MEKGTLTNTFSPSGPTTSCRGACNPCFLVWDEIGLLGGEWAGIDAPSESASSSCLLGGGLNKSVKSCSWVTAQ